MATEAPKKKGGRKKKPETTDESRFYIYLSPEGLELLSEMCAIRGGLARAKGTVIEECIRRGHASDTLLHDTPRRAKKRAGASE